MRAPLRVAALVAANLVLALLLLELALRAQEPFLHLMSRGHRDSPNYRFAVVDHPIWNHQLRPDLAGFEVEVRPKRPEEGLRFSLRTNSFGCRYGPLEVPRPASRFRVIVLGDSFTEGYREEDTVSAQLESALDAQGLPPDFEVVNCGMSSYSLLPILLRLREQLLAAAPDAVIVNIDLTDLHDYFYRRRPDLVVDARSQPVAVGERSRARPLRDFLDARSYAARALSAYGRMLESAVRDLLGTKRRNPDAEAGTPRLFTLHEKYRLHSHEPGAAADFEKAWAFFAEQLERIVALCREAGLDCAFSTYPHEAQLRAAGAPPLLHREFAKRIAAQLDRDGVFFYDAYADIAAAYASDPRLYFTDDMHFRPEGQRVWGSAFARAFAPWLRAAAQRRALAEASP
jgi:lysophospholipase L1-like esterase